MTLGLLLAVACLVGALQNTWFFWTATRRVLVERMLLTSALLRLASASGYLLVAIFLIHAGIYVYLVEQVLP